MQLEDGTLAYKSFLEWWPAAEDVYKAHQACIEAIRDTGINYVIWAPGRMQEAGYHSADVASTVIVIVLLA